MGNICNEKDVTTLLRLCWIERFAHANGGIKRSDAANAWGMSAQQISADIGRLIELHAGCLTYNLRAKRYEWTGDGPSLVLPSVCDLLFDSP